MVLIGFLVFAPANAASSCDTRDLVVVELDVVKGKEVMKVNDVVPKSGAAFDEFSVPVRARQSSWPTPTPKFLSC